MAELITYDFSAAGLKDAIDALGTTPNAVAANLLAMGFKGVIDDCVRCPVARYVEASIVGATSAVVEIEHAHVDNAANEIVAAVLPKPVKEFVELFDLHRYENLIEVSHATT